MPWKSTLQDGAFLASKAKGIYKPEWTEYALSVRQTLNGPYSDQEPVFEADGSWSYLYAQEADSEGSQGKYTNRALLACMKDQVPVGVMRQVSGKPNVWYRVLGLALVTGYDGGYFFLQGFGSGGEMIPDGSRTEYRVLTSEFQVSEFSPNDIIDGRKRIMTSIVQRQGQTVFRKQLMEAYEGKCAVSGFGVPEVLEAAHIVPYRGVTTNHPCNGLLLRADFHTLFDTGRMAVETKSMTIVLASILRTSPYSDFFGCRLALPRDGALRPSVDALDEHREWAGL